MYNQDNQHWEQLDIGSSTPPPQHCLSGGNLINGSHGSSMTLVSHRQVHELDRAWGMTEGSEL
jgi:hypothetical protein